MYSSATDVREALAPGSWRDTPAGGADQNPTRTAADLGDSQINDAIREADSTINAYIGRYYTTPVAGTGSPAVYPDPISAWSRNIAAYNATLTWRRGKDLSATDPVALRYAQTMTALTAVRDGKMSLQIPDNKGPNAAAGVGQAVNPYIGDLFSTDDFNLVPLNTGWPFQADIPGGRGPNW